METAAQLEGLDWWMHQAAQLRRSLSHHRRLTLCVASVVAVVCAAATIALPERYEASARILVDTDKALKPLMEGLAYQPDAEQKLRMLARTLLSHDNVQRLLEGLAVAPGTAPVLSDAVDRERAAQRLMDSIQIVPAPGAANLFDIRYRGRSPEQAQQVVQRTLALFEDSRSNDQRRDAEGARRFIDEQIRSYEAKLAQAEERLKDFKVRNLGVNGVAAQDWFTRAAALSDEVGKLQSDLAAAERSRQAYRTELAGEQARLAAEPRSQTIASPATAEAQARLAIQRKQLDELLRRYTEAHPDVVATRRAVADLDAEVARRLAADEQRVSAAGSLPQAARSPVYQQLRMAGAESESQVASLRSQLASRQAQLAQVRADSVRAPQVQAELAQLNRDYDIVRKNYEQMVARRESAALGLRLDESSQLASLRIIEPAHVASRAVFPSRVHLALLSIVLSLAAGALAAWLADRLRPTIGSSAQLRSFAGRPVIGTLSILCTPRKAVLRRQRSLLYLGLLSALLLAQLAWTAWLGASTWRH